VDQVKGENQARRAICLILFFLISCNFQPTNYLLLKALGLYGEGEERRQSFGMFISQMILHIKLRAKLHPQLKLEG
jgi:hypothetical protein